MYFREILVTMCSPAFSRQFVEIALFCHFLSALFSQETNVSTVTLAREPTRFSP